MWNCYLKSCSIFFLIIVQGNDPSHINEKQDSITKIVRIVQLAVKVVEVIGAEVVAEAVAGQDRIHDRQDLHQDQDLVQEAHTGVEIEVVMGVWI